MTNKVVILGAGPAGLSCALWLDNSGYSPVVLEQATQCGGMLRFNHQRNDWLLGFPEATGLSIRERFLAHVDRHDFSIFTSAQLSSLRRGRQSFDVSIFRDGRSEEISADFLVIASGTHPRAPAELLALSSSYPERCRIGAGELHVEDFVAGQRVAILGGGDNAFENAWLLGQRGVDVDIYFRGEVRARDQWRVRCSAMSEKIVLHSQADLGRFVATTDGVEFLVNDVPHRADVVVVMYGYAPNTGVLRRLAPWMDVVLNDEGFVVVDEYQRTAIARLYAIGDVTARPLPCLPSAIGQGSVAAKAIVIEAEDS